MSRVAVMPYPVHMVLIYTLVKDNNYCSVIKELCSSREAHCWSQHQNLESSTVLTMLSRNGVHHNI